MKARSADNYQSGWWRRHLAPIVVWLLAVVAVVGMFHRRTQRFEVVGVAQERSVRVAAPMTARIKDVPVQLFDRVESGQIVAVLESETMQSELAAARAEVERLTADLGAAETRLQTRASDRQTDWVGQDLRLQSDLDTARLRILEHKAQLHADRVSLTSLQQEVQILNELVDQEAAAPQEFYRAVAERDALAKKVEETEALLAEAQKELQQAQQRCERFAHYRPSNPDPELENTIRQIQRAVAAQESRIQHIEAQLSSLVLRSPIDGVVSRLPQRQGQVVTELTIRRPGETVVAGEPVLNITATKSNHVMGYIREDQVGLVREGIKVEIVKNTEPAQIAETRVRYVGPRTEEMPTRLWRNPNVPEWGRPFLVQVPEEMQLVPGELVGIRTM